MGKCKTKAIQTDLGTFRHNQTYPRIVQTYSGLFKTLYNPDMFRTAVYPELWHIQNQKHIQNTDILKIRGIVITMSNIYDEAIWENSKRL